MQPCRKDTFDLVLMDVQMPEMGGFEATRVIREKQVSTQKHTPIIAMTAHAMKGDRERCLAAGMDGYIAKPIRPAELFAGIERFTRRPEPTPEKLPSPSEDDCIDWQAAWANLEGDRKLLSDLALLFLDDLPQQMEAIHRAVDNRQDYDLERLAHRLKGSVGNFAAKPAFEAAFRLEKLAGQRDCKQVPPAVDRYDFGRARGGLVRRGGYTGRAVELRAKNNHSYTLDLLLAGPDLAGIADLVPICTIKKGPQRQVVVYVGLRGNLRECLAAHDRMVNRQRLLFA